MHHGGSAASGICFGRLFINGGSGLFGGGGRCGKQLVLDRRRPAVVLRFAPEPVNCLSVRNQQTTRWGEFAGLRVTGMSPGETATEDPVRAMEIGAVEETHWGKQVCGFPLLNRALD